MRGLGLLRKAVKSRPPHVTLATLAADLYWSERSMRRALREGGRIPPHVVATLEATKPTTTEK